MINVSSAFKKLIRKGANVVNYASFELQDGTELELEPQNFMVGGCEIEDATTNGSFSVGFTAGKTVTIRISNHNEEFSNYDFYNSIFYLYVACLLPNGTIEKVRRGKYYVITPQTPGDIIEFTGVDSMHLFNKKYDSSLAYPATLHQILADACLQCGVNVGFTQFDRYDYVVQTKPTDCSYIDVVGWVCQIAGYNARVNNDDELELVWWDFSDISTIIDNGLYGDTDQEYIIDGGDFSDYTTDLIIDGGNFTDGSAEGDFANITKVKTLTVETDDIQITGVNVVNDNVDHLIGTEGYVITLQDNPFTVGQEAVVGAWLYDKLNDFIFRPFSASIPNNPVYEPFDVVSVYDRKGNSYLTIINSVKYTVGSFTDIACKAESPARNESFHTSSEARAIVKARRDMDNKLSTYDLAVQNMNRIASNALGYFVTYEDQIDGSRITYLHDKPTLAQSVTIYKVTSDGFFVSQDGGQTYTAGFDAQGNAVVNILSAIGINFDWARGGTLTLGGLNNVNGQISMLNANGQQVGKWDNSTFRISDGTNLLDFQNNALTIGNIKVDNGFFINNEKYGTPKLLVKGTESVDERTSGSTVTLYLDLPEDYLKYSYVFVRVQGSQITDAVADMLFCPVDFINPQGVIVGETGRTPEVRTELSFPQIIVRLQFQTYYPPPDYTIARRRAVFFLKGNNPVGTSSLKTIECYIFGIV